MLPRSEVTNAILHDGYWSIIVRTNSSVIAQEFFRLSP
jgi:hypothetical protein